MSDLTTSFSGPAQVVLNLLSHGLSQELAAQSAGVSPSYVSQLLKEEKFALALAEKRSGKVEKAIVKANTYDRIEDKILKQIEMYVGMCMDPVKLAGILHRVVAARGREVIPVDPISQTGEHASITLPAIAINSFTLNVNNQVIATGDKTLVPIQSGAVEKLALATLEGNRNVKLLNDGSSGNT